MRSVIERLPTWLSAICSILTVAFVVWRGGALANTIAEHDRRIGTLESTGSVVVQKHVEKDDEREKAFDLRMERLEKIIERLPEMQSDIREIKTEIKNINKR